MNKKSHDALEYEEVTKLIYNEILKGEGYTNVEVCHDTVIQGNKGKHQIDVYWKFKYANIEHIVIIECKNYKRPISLSVVRSLESTVSDINNSIGIIITKTGAQKGALEYAIASGIHIKTLDFSKKEGCSTNVNLKLEFDYFIKYNFCEETNLDIENGNIIIPDKYNVRIYNEDDEYKDIKNIVSEYIVTQPIEKGKNYVLNLKNIENIKILALDKRTLSKVFLIPYSIVIDIIIINVNFALKIQWGIFVESVLKDIVNKNIEHENKIFIPYS